VSDADPQGFDPEAREVIEQAIAAAHVARDRAYAPYSGFSVGAAVVAEGLVFTGTNVENASYPVSACAERNAVAAMVDGGVRRVDALALVTSADEPTTPCGACRQVLWEFGPSSIVVAETTTGHRAIWALEDLLPNAFVLPGRRST
jgi:cytidine deaminase